MIIQGTRKSGITVSVEKYLLDKQKGQETIIIPYIYDIEQMEYSNTMEQQLRKDLQGDYVVIRIGYGKFDHYDFLKNAKAKILILSHSMAELTLRQKRRLLYLMISPIICSAHGKCWKNMFQNWIRY